MEAKKMLHLISTHLEDGITRIPIQKKNFCVNIEVNGRSFKDQRLRINCLGSAATTPPPQQGLLVSGGYRIQDTWADSRLTVELLYGNGSSCWLPSLPEGRWSHSQSGLVLCGGGAGEETRASCSALVAGAWLPSHTLQLQRWNHLSWETEGGILLLGGWDSGAGRTTELLSPASSTTTIKFALPYETR